MCPPPEIAPVVATNDTEEMVRSSSGRGSRSHSNDDDGDAGAVDNCCFTLSVSDVHNTKVSDNAGVFCVVDPVHVGGGGLGDNSTSEAATLEVTVFPSDGWEKGSSQEVRYAYFLSRPVESDTGVRTLFLVAKNVERGSGHIWGERGRRRISSCMGVVFTSDFRHKGGTGHRFLCAHELVDQDESRGP